MRHSHTTRCSWWWRNFLKNIEGKIVSVLRGKESFWSWNLRNVRNVNVNFYLFITCQSWLSPPQHYLYPMNSQHDFFCQLFHSHPRFGKTKSPPLKSEKSNFSLAIQFCYSIMLGERFKSLFQHKLKHWHNYSFSISYFYIGIFYSSLVYLFFNKCQSNYFVFFSYLFLFYEYQFLFSSFFLYLFILNPSKLKSKVI